MLLARALRKDGQLVFRNNNAQVHSRYIFSALYERFLGVSASYSAATSLGIGKTLLESSKQAASAPHWTKLAGLSTDFRTKHGLILVHLWVLDKRVVLEGPKATRVREALFDCFWEDTSSRLRANGVPELSVHSSSSFFILFFSTFLFLPTLMD